MFQSYPDIQYDESTRRTNRIMKFIGVPIAALLAIGVIAALVAAVEGLSNDASVMNDTNGRVICYARFTNASDETTVNVTARIAAGDSADVTLNSRCAVFSQPGDYVGCFDVRKTGDDSQILASTNNSRVKVEACVYPR